jgi:predicted lipid-binding transport protein (Tim44 family)
MKKLTSFFSMIVLLFSLSIFSVADVQARFGGGHSSHSSRSSSSHSSSRSRSSSWSNRSNSPRHYSSGHASSNSANNGFVLLAIIVIVLIVLYIIWVNHKKQPQTVISKSPIKRFDETQLINFKQQDAHFSRILFLDFVHLLYVKYYSFYGKKEFSYLSPYLDKAVLHDKKLDLLIGNQVIVISEIVINSIRLYLIDSMNNEDRIVVEIDSNYTIHPAFHTTDSGKKHTRYMITERWFFQRAKGVLSPPPEKMQALTCPVCGAPAHFTDAGQCGSCGTTIIKGQQQWYLKERYLLEQTVLETGDLISYADEEGTALTTLTSPTILQEIAAFENQRSVTWSQYWDEFKQQIVQSYFLELNTAWTTRHLNKVRHLISDRLYEANSFWMDLYQHYGLNNRLDDLKIESIQLAKIEMDLYYEVITVRVFASCFDYTLDKSNKIMGGSNKKRRAYSEYWTFAQRAGVEHSNAVVDLTVCPQCAAPADKMGQTAVCGYCGTKISSGEFSWVLFLITQDENYAG